jgi:hypothetical protein
MDELAATHGPDPPFRELRRLDFEIPKLPAQIFCDVFQELLPPTVGWILVPTCCHHEAPFIPAGPRQVGAAVVRTALAGVDRGDHLAAPSEI